MEENYSIAKNKVFYSVVALAIIGIVNICFVSFAGEYATAYSVDNPWLLFLFPVLMSSAYIYYFVALGHLKRAIVEDCVRAVVLLRISSALLAFSSLLSGLYAMVCFRYCWS